MFLVFWSLNASWCDVIVLVSLIVCIILTNYSTTHLLLAYSFPINRLSSQDWLLRRPRCSLHLWANCGRDLGRFNSSTRWTWKEDLWKHGRGSTDQLHVPKDFDFGDFGAALQCCPFAWQFTGYRLHRLMIIPNFLFTFNFFNLPRDYMYRGLNNDNDDDDLAHAVVVIRNSTWVESILFLSQSSRTLCCWKMTFHRATGFSRLKSDRLNSLRSRNSAATGLLLQNETIPQASEGSATPLLGHDQPRIHWSFDVSHTARAAIQSPHTRIIKTQYNLSAWCFRRGNNVLNNHLSEFELLHHNALTLLSRVEARKPKLNQIYTVSGKNAPPPRKCCKMHSI